MSPELANRIARIAADRESGASEILAEAVEVLSQALAGAGNVAEVARAIVRAQPTLGPMWNAAIAAVAAVEQPDRFERFRQRVARAPDALGRFASEFFDSSTQPLQIATVSYSRTVLDVLTRLAERRQVHVACAEGRPALEGRTLASRLVERGVRVTFFTDAAISHALPEVDAVLVGADAVGPEWFQNKTGTRMLAATAVERGIPLYVLASRDKFVPREIATRLEGREGAAVEVWPGAPVGITVRNPYFEAIPLHLVAALITDFGVLGPADVPEVCASAIAESNVIRLLLF
jgi:methylthioribose-1-phosphate isomerase